jgi:hypothetical protein
VTKGLFAALVTLLLASPCPPCNLYSAVSSVVEDVHGSAVGTADLADLYLAAQYRR